MNDDFSEGDELTDEDLVRLAEFFASDNVQTVSRKASLAIAELQGRRAKDHGRANSWATSDCSAEYRAAPIAPACHRRLGILFVSTSAELRSARR
jgi:hypothetical protein